MVDSNGQKERVEAGLQVTSPNRATESSREQVPSAHSIASRRDAEWSETGAKES